MCAGKDWAWLTGLKNICQELCQEIWDPRESLLAMELSLSTRKVNSAGYNGKSASRPETELAMMHLGQWSIALHDLEWRICAREAELISHTSKWNFSQSNIQEPRMFPALSWRTFRRLFRGACESTGDERVWSTERLGKFTSNETQKLGGQGKRSRFIKIVWITRRKKLLERRFSSILLVS